MPPERERDRYAEIFDEAPVGRLITDRHGVVEDVNRAAAALLGVTQALLVGRPLAVFVPPGDRRDFRNRLLAAPATTTPLTWVTWLQPRNSAPFRAEVHVVGSQSEIGYLYWAITDVSERIATEEELRLLAEELEARVEARTRDLDAERARLAAVVDQIPAGLLIIANDGRVVMANPEAHRLLGEDVMEWFAVVPDEDGRVEVTRSDGTPVVLEVSTAAIRDITGIEAGAIQLFHDVSERERQEKAQREFVTNAAHQLQSPLAAIVSAIEVLQSGAKDGPERDVFLGHIDREAARLARLARALLVLARAQTGYEAPKDELVSLEPLLSEVATTLRPAKGVTVEVRCKPDVAVVTNRELAEQALLNVAENAAKYTAAGRISLEARLVEGNAEVVVADTGPGIPDEDQPYILERFYRAARNGADGFGLGFSIVRSAMEALGGELEISSNAGSGTVVTLRLPTAASLVES